MALPAVMEGIGMGLSGLSALLQASGIVKSPEQKMLEEQNKQRDAQRAYLEKNLPEFSYSKQDFDPSQYQDILQPLQQRIQGQQQQLGNQVALSGQGRGGVSQELALRQMNRGNQNMNNTMTGLARTSEQDAYQRALQAYQMKADRARALAEVQG